MCDHLSGIIIHLSGIILIYFSIIIDVSHLNFIIHLSENYYSHVKIILRYFFYYY